MLFVLFLSNQLYILNVFSILIDSSVKINQPKIIERNVFKSSVKDKDTNVASTSGKICYLYLGNLFKIFSNLFLLAF